MSGGHGAPFRASWRLSSLWAWAVSPDVNCGRSAGPWTFDRLADRLPYPPSCVSRNLEAFPPVVPVDSAGETDVALLDQIKEPETPAVVPLGDGNDEAQVRLGQLATRVFVTGLDRHSEPNLVLARQQREGRDLG